MWTDKSFFHDHEIIQVYEDKLPKKILLNATHLPKVRRMQLLTKNMIKEVYLL